MSGSDNIPGQSHDQGSFYEFNLGLGADEIQRRWHAEQAGWPQREEAEKLAYDTLYGGEDIAPELIDERLRAADINFRTVHGLDFELAQLDYSPELYEQWVAFRQLVTGEATEVIHPLDPVRGILAEALFMVSVDQATNESLTYEPTPEEITSRLQVLMQRNVRGLSRDEYREATTLVFKAPLGEHLCLGCEVTGRQPDDPTARAVTGLPHCKDHLRYELMYKETKGSWRTIIRKTLDFGTAA